MKLQRLTTIFILFTAIASIALWAVMNNAISNLVIESGVDEIKDLVKDPFGNSDLFYAATETISPLYILISIVFIALMCATLFTVVSGILKKNRSLKKIAIGVGAFLFIVIISYAISKGADEAFKLGHYEYDGVMASESESKIVGAGLITFYILIIISILSMLISGLKKMFK